MIFYYNAKEFISIDSLVRIINKEHSISNLFIGKPIKLMGNSSILEMRDVGKNKVIKVEGETEILCELYQKLISN